MSQIQKRKKPINTRKVPDEILQSSSLNQAIKDLLPQTYNFELHKCIHQLRQMQPPVKRLALQLPDGLQMFAMALSSLFQEFVCYNYTENRQGQDQQLDVVILADVTYGACCVDDFTAGALDCDVLIHYGHSCLVPVTTTNLHLMDTIKLNFEVDQKLTLISTIQFAASLHSMSQSMVNEGYQVEVPQAKPLSRGEVLGCTSPKLQHETDAVIYIGDGRFHLESMMIANPQLGDRFYQYNPYDCKLTKEGYGYEEMCRMRADAVIDARTTGKSWGLLVGTLGRQGNMRVVQYLQKLIEEHHKCTIILISELSIPKLAQFAGIDIFVQTSCPRLSIDWGYLYDKPLLTPYEAVVALRKESPSWMCQDKGDGCCQAEEYPMDFYAKDSLGPWTPNHSST